MIRAGTAPLVACSPDGLGHRHGCPRSLTGDPDVMGSQGADGAGAEVRGKVSMKKLFGRKNKKKDGTEGKVRCSVGPLRQRCCCNCGGGQQGLPAQPMPPTALAFANEDNIVLSHTLPH